MSLLGQSTYLQVWEFQAKSPCFVYKHGGSLRIKPLGLMGQHLEQSFPREWFRPSIISFMRKKEICVVRPLRFQGCLLRQHSTTLLYWSRAEGWEEDERREDIKLGQVLKLHKLLLPKMKHHWYKNLDICFAQGLSITPVKPCRDYLVLLSTY